MEQKSQVVETHVVPQLSAPVRLSDYGGGIFNLLPSRKGVKKAIQQNRVLVNDKIGHTGDWIKGGETIALLQSVKIKPENVKLDISVLWEDEHVAVVNKPPGLLVSGNRKWTLENGLAHALKLSSEEDRLRYPEAIHRLDYPTSGCLLIGKTSSAVRSLNLQFVEKVIRKKYLAVCQGLLQESGEISTMVDDKPALSKFKRLQKIPSEKYTQLNLVELEPVTGRRHQLRKHLSHLGCPIFGDQQYGLDQNVLRGKGLYLHAFSLQFKHPSLGTEILIKAPIPKKFIKLFGEIAY